MSCVIFSNVSSNWLGPTWLELKEPFTVICGGLLLLLPFCIFSFLDEWGDACTFVRVLEVSARARFAGALATAPGILRIWSADTTPERVICDGW
jgi:hypothetical protein